MEFSANRSRSAHILQYNVKHARSNTRLLRYTVLQNPHSLRGTMYRIWSKSFKRCGHYGSP